MRRTLSIGAILSLTLSGLALAQPPQGPPGQDQHAQGGPTTRPAQGARPVGQPGGGPGGGHGGAPGGGGPGGGKPGGGLPGGGPGGGKPGGGLPGGGKPGGGAPGGPGGGAPGGGGRPPQHGQRPPTGNPGGRPPTGAPGGRPPTGAPGGRPPTANPGRPGQPWRPGSPANQWRPPTGGSWFWYGRTMRRIRAPVFRYPPGYAYRRWTAGSILPRLFLSSLYFYSGWSPLGLPAPPPGYAWVRYGPDLLMVELGSGRVVDVAYGVFL